MVSVYLNLIQPTGHSYSPNKGTSMPAHVSAPEHQQDHHGDGPLKATITLGPARGCRYRQPQKCCTGEKENERKTKQNKAKQGKYQNFYLKRACKLIPNMYTNVMLRLPIKSVTGI